MNKKIVIGVSILVFIVAISVLRPVPIVSEEKALVEKGVVTKIYEGGEKDVVFLLANNDCSYYINRGIESGLVIQDLREQLIGKEIVVKYPKYWTPLDWNNKTKHISKVEFGEKVLFNELK